MNAGFVCTIIIACLAYKNNKRASGVFRQEEDYVSYVMIDETSADVKTAVPAADAPGRPVARVDTADAAEDDHNNGGGGGGTDNDVGPDEPIAVVKQEANGAGPSSDGGDHDSVPAYAEASPTGADDDRSLEPTDDDVKPGTTAKYCKACDISFNYLTTFIAHKKYYCRNSTEQAKCNAAAAEHANTAVVTS